MARFGWRTIGWSAIGIGQLGVLTGCGSESVAAGSMPLGETCEGVDGEAVVITSGAGTSDADIHLAADTESLVAEQVVSDGIAVRASTITLPWRCSSVEVASGAALRVDVPIANPETGATDVVAFPVVDAIFDAGLLSLRFDGPASAGSVLRVSAGALRVEGMPVAPAELEIDVDAPSARWASLWFKAFEPLDRDRFPASVYGGTAETGAEPQPADDAAIVAALDAHFRKVIAAGGLSDERAAALLARFWAAARGEDAVTREVFSDENDKFEPHLMAATLATAGTVMESAIEAILDGQNEAGVPMKVAWAGAFEQELPEGANAQVRTARGDGRSWIFVARHFAAEPFAVLAPVLGHEALHQDGRVAREEEAVAKVLSAVAWGQLLLADPTLGDGRGTEARNLNLELLWLLNSGARAFPWPGYAAGPLLQAMPSVEPNSGRYSPSFAASVDTLYGDVAPGETPGNEHLRQALVRLSGEPPPTDVRFDAELLFGPLDAIRTFTDEQLFELLGILRLTLATAP